jgi:hypothetical protein
VRRRSYRHCVIAEGKARWSGHVARMGEMSGLSRFLEEKPEGKGSLRRPRRRWEDNIETDLQEVELTGSSWLRIGTGGGHLRMR